MTRSPFAVSASPRGARPHGWLLLASLLLPLAVLQAGTPPEPERPWPPSTERTPIQPEEVHVWTFDMTAGDFLDVVVAQDGIDVVVELFEGPNRILEVDSPDECLCWQEEASFKAERSGTYRLVVYPYNKQAAPGHYTIRADGPRPFRPEDSTRIDAFQEMEQATAEFVKHGRQEVRLEHLARALDLWRQLDDRRHQAEVLFQMGTTANDLQRTEEASRYFHRSLDVWDQLGLVRQRAWTLWSAAQTDMVLLHEDHAKSHVDERIRLVQRLGDQVLLQRVLHDAGNLFKSDPHVAVEYFEKAYRLAQEIGASRQELLASYELGRSYDDLGEKQKALPYYENARDLADQQHELGIKANVLNGLGLFYASLGQTDKAIEYYNQSLKINEKQTATLNNLALIKEKLDPDESRRLYQQILDLGPETSNQEAQAAALSNMALLEARIGNPARALELGDEALNLKVKRFEIPSLQAKGMARRRMGELDSSRRDLERALDLSRQRQDRVRESMVILQLARTVLKQEDLHATLDLLKSGIGIVESLRTKVVGEELRATFLASRQDVYSLCIDTLMALDKTEPGKGYDTEALQVSERARARSLLDILAAARTDFRDQAEPLNVVQIQSDILDSRALLLEYALGEERSFLWAVTPDGVRSFVLPPRATIEDAARRYYKALSTPPLPAAGKTVQANLETAAAELSRMLLQPVQGMLSGQPLLVVSDGALQYVPFAALPAPSSLDRAERVPLIVGHQVVSLPSASTLAVLRRELAGRPAPPKILAVLANPIFHWQEKRSSKPSGARGAPEGMIEGIDLSKLRQLAWSKVEATKIAALVPDKEKKLVALEYEATRDKAISGQLASYQMVHFATHGLIDSRHPELSSLVLSLVDKNGRRQDGLLRLHDIYNMKLNADLVVLSACQTALGQEIRGEGLLGLTRGFMYAGAARVLASLWSVDDRATAELMREFYQHMISDRMSPAEALRQTQISMSRNDDWKSPYYWAAFSLQGEWQ